MIHVVPELPANAATGACAEAIARLATLHHALRLADPAAVAPSAADVPAAWDTASEASRRCFTARSERAVGAATAGLQAVLAERSAGREPNSRSVERLAQEIRTGIDELQRLLSR